MGSSRLVRRPLALGIVVAAAYLLSARHAWPGFFTANESIRYFFAAALVEDGTVAIERAMARYHSHNIDRAEHAGHVYLDKAPGTSILALPAYLAWTRIAHPSAPRPPGPPVDHVLFWMTLLACGLPVLAAALALGIAADRSGLGPQGGAALALAVVAATPLGLYGALFFGHAGAAAGLAGAFALLELGPRRDGWAAVSGLCAGAAVACEYTVAPLAVALGFLALARGGLRAGGLFAGGALPVGIGLCLYHAAAFGGPFATGYSFKAAAQQAAWQGSGLAGFHGPRAGALFGLTLSRERGLFFLCPWLLLALPGLVALARQPERRPSAAFLAVACLGMPLLVASSINWAGGDCVGPRHLVGSVPFFAYAAAHAPSAFGRWPRLAQAVRTGGCGLAAASLAQLWFPFASFPFHNFGVPDPLYTVSVPLVLEGHLAPSPLSALGLPAAVAATLPPLVALGAAAALAARRRLHELAIAATVAILFLAAMSASSPGAPPEALAARRQAILLMTR